MELTVNFERLRENINELAAIGKREDGGIYRMAFTPEEIESRKWLEARMQDAGLSTYLDGAVNVVGRIDNGSDKAAMVIGSHLDTVPNAGALDGALGVLVGLECLTRIREEGIRPNIPIELVAFSDEEGRFGGMFGSRAFSGQINPGILEESCDLDGVTLRHAMETTGFEVMHALDASRNPATVSSYLELHIEQGPVLDTEGQSVGVVTDITGLFKWQVMLRGTANHAGTTPMELRRDAFMGLADFAHEIPRIIDENGSESSRITIGKVTLHPGSANTIPGQVEFSLDVRDVAEDIMVDLRDACRKALSALARRKQLIFEFQETSWIQPVACDDHLRKTIVQQARDLGMDYREMYSGAAHDAQMVAAIAPIAMIFVPSKNGISHSPHEWTDWHHIECGANLMLQSILKISEKDG